MQIYYLLCDGTDAPRDVYTDEDAALDRLAREPEHWTIKPVIDLNTFTSRTIQTHSDAEQVAQQLNNTATIDWSWR